VIVRRFEQRATGQFLKVQGRPGIVVSMPGWMVDPTVCAGMEIGRPLFELRALFDLKRLVAPPAASTNFPRENQIAREEVDGTTQRACADCGQADEPDIVAPRV
jgi:hypothetical protein